MADDLARPIPYFYVSALLYSIALGSFSTPRLNNPNSLKTISRFSLQLTPYYPYYAITMKADGKKFTIRYQTKKQLEIVRKAANAEYRSMNSFIVRETLKAAEQAIRVQQQEQQTA